ncbi:MAG: hypothetical protein EON59_03015 [Alphaproteobacteria bacterium]|nr:MAG: hypothetical protein EON59_03015 [Alphaproteobacteria bacterium]
MLLLATRNHAQTASQLAPPRIAPPVIRFGSAVAVPQSIASRAPPVSGAQRSVSLEQSTVFERSRIDASGFGVGARVTVPAGLAASAEYGRASTDVLAGSTDRLTFSIIAQF